MKNDYNKKKRITIIALSAVAVCLAGGLFWYMGTLGSTQPPVAQTESQPETEPVVTVPEIKSENTTEPSVTEPITTEPETTSEPKSTAGAEPENSGHTGTVTSEVQKKPSEGKPKIPEKATPPAEPPKDEAQANAPVENPDAGGTCQPEHTPQPEPDQPQGGEKQNGKIYVPGFGWIEDEGGGSDVHEAPNAGTGEPVGEM